MPTYDYECRSCGHTFEAFQSIKAGALRKCPSCGTLKLRRLIGSGAGIIFKGSGFYETDYKRKSGSSTSDSASGKSGTSDGGKKETPAKTSPSETKTDSAKTKD